MTVAGTLQRSSGLQSKEAARLPNPPASMALGMQPLQHRRSKRLEKGSPRRFFRLFFGNFWSFLTFGSFHIRHPPVSPHGPQHSTVIRHGDPGNRFRLSPQPRTEHCFSHPFAYGNHHLLAEPFIPGPAPTQASVQRASAAALRQGLHVPAVPRGISWIFRLSCNSLSTRCHSAACTR